MFKLQVNCFLQKQLSNNTLFDFSFNSITQKISKSIKSTSYLYKEPSNLILSPNHLNFQEDQYLGIKDIPINIGSVIVDKQKFTFKSIKNTNWLSIRDLYSTHNYGFQLHEGDMVSFGNVTFRINELKSIISSKEEKNGKSNMSNKDNNDNGSVASYINEPSLSSESNGDSNSNRPTCRICLSKSSSDSNPLISPCLCSGTVKHIHLNCLKQWLKSKVEVKDYDYITMITYQKCECELCHGPIPSKYNIIYLTIIIAKIKYQSKTIYFHEITKPDNDYIIIENIPSKEKKRLKSFLYIIKFDKKQSIRVGRTNNVEISMADVSVSRLHAAFNLINNSFYLEDLNSKFGTLVDLQYDIVFLPYKPIGIFNEKCKIVFDLKKTCLGLFKCFSSNFFNWDDYNTQLCEVCLKRKQSECDNNEGENDTVIDLSPNRIVNKDSSRNKKQDNLLSSVRKELIVNDNNSITLLANTKTHIMKQDSHINLLQGSDRVIYNGGNGNGNGNGDNNNDNHNNKDMNNGMIQRVNQSRSKVNAIERCINRSPSKMYYIKQTSGLKKAKTSDKHNDNINQDSFSIQNNNNNIIEDNSALPQMRIALTSFNQYESDDKNSNKICLEEPENESIHLCNENALFTSRHNKQRSNNINSNTNNTHNTQDLLRDVTQNEIEQVVDVNQIINNCIEEDEPGKRPKIAIKPQNAIQFTLEKRKRKSMTLTNKNSIVK